MGVVERILELARWAPSGDNTQPWRFEIVDERRFVVHGFDTRDWCLYDIDGRPSQIALGALLENVAIAASTHAMRASIVRRADTPETQPTFDVQLEESADVRADLLAPFIAVRSVQRRALRTRPLSAAVKRTLEAAVGADHSVHWLEGAPNRRAVAALMFRTSALRLTAPEAYEVHRRVIAWNSRFSEDKVPDAAIGLDPLTTRLMAFVMRDWTRVRLFNRYLAGTLTPRIQLDIIPSLACAAHFLIRARATPRTVDDYVSAGRAMQRFWLTVTHQGLQLQPEMSPLIFAAYARQNRPFTASSAIWQRAKALGEHFDRLVAPDAATTVFMGRLGEGPAPRARSLRRPLAALLVERAPRADARA
jgi:nitroreductase